MYILCRIVLAVVMCLPISGVKLPSDMSQGVCLNSSQIDQLKVKQLSNIISKSNLKTRYTIEVNSQFFYWKTHQKFHESSIGLVCLYLFNPCHF